MSQQGMPQGIPVVVLKEGTTTTTGKKALRTNIMVAKVVAEAIRTALGPRGMDKMLIDSFGDVTITNDGATILKEIDVEHPTAKMLVEVAKAQDSEAGDGTTSVVVLAGELLSLAEELLDQQIHPVVIVEGYREAARKAIEILDEIAIKVDPKDREMLKKVAMTVMASKVVAAEREHLAELVLDAILKVMQKKNGETVIDIDDIKVEKKEGGSLKDSMLIEGLVIDKELVHPKMPKVVRNAKIALLQAPLEVEKTEFDAKIHITDPEQLKKFIDGESNIIREYVKKLKEAGANVVFCQKGIDELAQYWLAKEGIAAVRRVKKSDMEKLKKATGAKIITNIKDIKPEDLGYAGLVEERKIGDEKMIFIEKCKNPTSVAILIRGATERLVEEAERSIHDALCVIRDTIIDGKVVVGGGAVEVELARRIREWAQTLKGKKQLAALKFADALEVIPKTLAENAGFNPMDAIAELRARHEAGNIYAGVDVFKREIADMKELEVYDAYRVKKQMIESALEVATAILRVDNIIAASKLKEEEEGEEEKK